MDYKNIIETFPMTIRLLEVFAVIVVFSFTLWSFHKIKACKNKIFKKFSNINRR